MDIKWITRRFLNRIWSTELMILLEYIPDSSGSNVISNKFELANSNNLYDVLSFEDAHYVKRLQRMREKGEIGILGYLNNRCVFQHWLQMKGSITHEGTSILQLEDKCCYSHYVFCDKSARKHGFHTESILLVKNILPDYKVYTLVNSTNDKSMRNYLRCGFTRIKEVRVVMRFFTKKITVQDPGLPEGK